MVVGAGLAGLSAAYGLKGAGYTAAIHEASDRIGGRCCTIRGAFADGQIAEHGSELIDQGHGEIRKLAQELGLKLDNWIEETFEGGIGSRIGQLLDVAYTIEYGAESAEQSSLNLLYLLGYSGQGQFRVFGPSNEKYHVAGGNDQITGRLAARLAGQITTGSELVAVRRNASGSYTLTFRQSSGTKTVTADKPGTAGRRSTAGPGTAGRRAPTPTGRSGSTSASPAWRGAARATASSPASTRRSTSRGT